MAKKKAAARKVAPRPKLSKDELKAEEARLKKMYPNIVEGTLRNVSDDENDDFYQKRSVVIKCAHPGCNKTRRIATSDLHQVTMCPEHTRLARLERRKEARKLTNKKRPAKVAKGGRRRKAVVAK